ncbi:MAG: hypothetical protein JXM70_17560 [Pirellulales bacterium]|nr:hypothetical protein [Pirellulales bacterium]
MSDKKEIFDVPVESMVTIKSLLPIFVCVFIFVLVLWFAFNIMWAYACRDITPRGPLPNAVDWPEPVQQMHDTLTKAEVDIQSFAVYLIYGQPGDLFSTVVCRMDSSTSACNTLAEHLNLQPISRDLAAKYAGKKTLRFASSDWWPSKDDENVEYYASKNIFDAYRDALFIVAYDKSRNKIFIYYYNEF